MGTKKYGFFASVLSASVLLLLLLFSTVSLVLAPKIISCPTGTIEVTQGLTFTLQHKFEWDEAAAGFYSVALYWWYWGLDDWHFTVDNYRAYFENGAPIECTKSEMDNGDLLSILLRNTVADARDGVFYVDLRLRARGPLGTPHQVTENHPILYTKLRCNETGTTETTPGPVTIKVLGIGVDVLISPDENSALPGVTLNYTVTVTNTGDVYDNYDLSVSDNANWNPTLTDNLLRIPAGENQTTTLSVTIPENAIGCTRDKITVTATSKLDNTVENSDNCVAHVTIVRCVNVEITPGSKSAKPCTTLNYTVTLTNTGNVDDNYDLIVNDSAGWGDNVWLEDNSLWVERYGGENTTILHVHIPENVEPDAEDNITVTARSMSDPLVENSDNCMAYVARAEINILVSPSYKSGLPSVTLEYTVTVINKGTIDDNYELGAGDNAGWSLSLLENSFEGIAPGGNRTTTLNVSIPENALGCTEDNVTVTARSQFDNTVENEGSCIAHATVVRSVNVLISPGENSVLPGENACFVVTVTNEGNIYDNYELCASDNARWDLSLLENLFEGIAPGGNRTTTLNVKIGENAPYCTSDNVTVTATSRENAKVSDNASCIAHAGGGKFELENLYAVTLEFDCYLAEGENLVAKFYTYGGGKYQDETIVCSENIPGHVTLLENVSRPGNGAIQRVELVLVDSENNVLRTIKTFEASRTILMGRLSDIDLIWPFASMEERTQLMAELGDIDLIWPFAPPTFEDP